MVVLAELYILQKEFISFSYDRNVFQCYDPDSFVDYSSVYLTIICTHACFTEIQRGSLPIRNIYLYGKFLEISTQC